MGCFPLLEPLFITFSHNVIITFLTQCDQNHSHTMSSKQDCDDGTASPPSPHANPPTTNNQPTASLQYLRPALLFVPPPEKAAAEMPEMGCSVEAALFGAAPPACATTQGTTMYVCLDPNAPYVCVTETSS